MNYEFQVVYRERDLETPRLGPVMTVRVIARDEGEARARVESPGILVVSVAQLGPVVDWRKPNFDRDEAAAWWGIKSGTLSVNKGSGTLPFATVNGRAIYPREWLEKHLERCGNEAARRLAGGGE